MRFPLACLSWAPKPKQARGQQREHRWRIYM